MATEPESEFATPLEALAALARELWRIARQANDTTKQLPSDDEPLQPQTEGDAHQLVPPISADTAAISRALRYQPPGKPAHFMYLGELEIKKAVRETLDSFKPTVSTELLNLGNDRNVASALGIVIKKAIDNRDHRSARTLANSCREHLINVIDRASVLSLKIQFLRRSFDDQVLQKLLKGEGAEYVAWRDAFEAAQKKVRDALNAAYPNPKAVQPVSAASLLVTTDFELRPNQRTINGIYFPPKHEEALLQHLAARQVKAKTQARQTG